MLIKFRLTLTVVFSSVMAFLIAAQTGVNPVAVLVLALGGFLVTGAANTLNQVMEKDFDRLMKRTMHRPLAAGRMQISEAVMAAGLMSLFGISLLAMFNPWTAFLGTVAMLSYAFLYTPLKRITPNAVAVGAIPGALPVMIGSAAAEGQITLLALALFALQFCWQFPHFWSIGWLGYEDYRNAGYKLLPAKSQQDRNTGKQSLLYTLFLAPISALPFLMGISGAISLGIVLALTAGYAWFAWRFYRDCNRKAALGLMFYSFFYIPVALIAFYFDKI